MSYRQRPYQSRHLALVAKAESFRDSREPALRIGDWARLNSGGPIALVVDAGDQLTIAWRDRCGTISESTLPEPCLHRVCLSSTLFPLSGGGGASGTALLRRRNTARAARSSLPLK